jgi:hypothetical protein
VKRRALLAVSIAVLMVLPSLVRAQLGPNVTSGLFSSTSASGSFPRLNVKGDQTCTFFVNSGGGATFTVTGASDAGVSGTPTMVTNALFPSSGVIVAPAANTYYSGSVSSLNTFFQVTWTGNTGTVQGTESCTAANSGGTFTGTVTANVPTPLSVIGPGGSPVPVNISGGTGFPTPVPYATSAGTVLKVDGSAVTQPVSGSVTVSGTVTATGVATPVPYATSAGTVLKVDGSAVTQPVSGTITCSNCTGATPIPYATAAGTILETQIVNSPAPTYTPPVVATTPTPGLPVNAALLGFNASGQTQGVSVDSNGYVNVDCKTNCTVFPYGTSTGQTALSNSFLGAALVGSGGTVAPLQGDAAWNLYVAERASTGGGFTHYSATSITAGTAATISSTANTTLAALTVSWSVPSTTTNCYLTLYNSASPTVGTGFVAIYPINTAAPGELALPIPPTIGGKFSTAISYALTTTPTGSTACNSASNQVWLDAWYI